MDHLKAPSLSSLISGTDRGSSDSLLGSINLDLDGIDDDLSSLPPVGDLPSLDAILTEFDSDLDSLNSSTLAVDKVNATPTSFDGKHHLTGSILRHVLYQGISTQIASASDRTEAGFASCVAVSRMVAVGTMHGFILAFDSSQVLRWCCQDGQKKEQGSVASLSFNYDDTRLLAGFSRGAIFMINTMTGDVIRTLLEAVTPNAGVLSLKWTSRQNLALSLDTGGSVWSLSFTRKLGIRGCDSRCLFSGARGEVCTFEPLIIYDERHPLRQNYCLVALATLSKFFILMIRPRLKVIKYHLLNGPPDSLPLLSWQLVLIQSATGNRTVDPVLATGRGSQIYFHQVQFTNGRISVTFLRHINLDYNLLALQWLGPKNIACVERNTEMLHLMDVRTSRQLETIDCSSFGIVYQSAQFKGIATGGNVSPALALAGTFACYSTVVSNELNGTLYILGQRSLHGVNARNFGDRLTHLSSKQNWLEAFELAIDGFKNSTEKPRRHGITKEKILHLYADYLNSTTRTPELYLDVVIQCLVTVDEADLIWQELWERLETQDLFLNLITRHIVEDELTFISPSVSQSLLDYWSHRSIQKLELIILKLNWQCLDLHQTLSLVKKLKMHKAMMHLYTKALNDYAASLVELIPLINNTENEDRVLGNNLLVYISSCLAGRGYPTGDIDDVMIPTVKHEIMRILTAQHSMNAPEDEKPFPYLRQLLKFDMRDTLNVLSIAFMEKEFSSELGLSQRQRIINILLEIVEGDGNELSEQMGVLCNFISQQITTKSLPDSSLYLSKIITYIITEADSSISSRQHIEKEQTFLNLMEANALNTNFTFEELLAIANKTKCFMVSQFILEKLKRYDKIIECFILSNNKFELFRYIMMYKSKDDRKIYQQIQHHFQSILEMDSTKIANIIIEYYPICIQQFIKSLLQNPQLFYEFVNEIIANGAIQLETENYNDFLTLQCEYNPNSVLEFLQNSNNSYDIQHAINIVEKTNLSSAMIYLYEKSGQHGKAFKTAMDLLKESPESLAENYALKVGYLCMRASNVITAAEREAFWFELIDVIMSRNYLASVVKQILHLASSFVDLNKLVQVIMEENVNGNSRNFGDIKQILIGLLSNFEYESLLLRTSQNVLSRDLHRKLVKSKELADVGIYCKIPKCILCKRKLSDVIITESSDEKSDQIIVFSNCGHSIHSSCFEKQEIDKKVEDPETNISENCDNKTETNSIKCKQCGMKIVDSEPIYLNKTNYKLFPENLDVTIGLQLKSPARLGLVDIKK